jgi:RNA 2',3'-cyclic 3'-phosphodiesterase
MLRSFIAIETPLEIQNSIAQAAAPLKNLIPKHLVRWVAPQNAHLTLKFLGDVSPANLERLAEALKLEAASHEMFSLSVGGLGAFPNPRRARVIWLGLEAPPALAALQHAVDGASAKLGYPMEERPFSPHLTIGRVAQTASGSDLRLIRSALESTKVGILGTIRVQAIHIFKSLLQPAGPIYTILYTLSMKST